MTTLVATIRKIIPSDFWVSEISDQNIKIDVSKEKEPKLIIRFNPKRENFGKRIDQHVTSPDFLFASDHPAVNGRLFVIELSGGRDKTRRKLENQLASGFAQLEKCMMANNVKSFKSMPKVMALYFGNMNSKTRRDIKKRPLVLRFFGHKVPFKILERKSGLEDVS